jgi:outer membrane protein OmpA-like peptidoglycan-associated protein
VPLDKLADLLTVHAGYRVRIVGHVDPGSDSVSGRNLAEDRANAVKQYLLIKGIATRRILAEASEKADSAGRYNSVSCVVEGSR